MQACQKMLHRQVKYFANTLEIYCNTLYNSVVAFEVSLA